MEKVLTVVTNRDMLDKLCAIYNKKHGTAQTDAYQSTKVTPAEDGDYINVIGYEFGTIEYLGRQFKLKRFNNTTNPFFVNWTNQE